jgi:hypothetical protein
MLENVREKVSLLSTDNYIRKALSDNTLDEIESTIRKLPENELAYEYYPQLFFFVCNNNESVINELNEDIILIKDNTTSKNFKGLITFLKSSRREVRRWSSGLFEIFIKMNLLKKFSKDNIRLDKKLFNGRNLDAAVKLNNKWYNFEATILSSSDDDYNAYDRYIEALKNNPNEVLVESKDVHKNKLRVFRKVYDKIADTKLNIERSQISPDEPNILLLFVGDTISPLTHTTFPVTSLLGPSRAVGWAFDELFADQPTNNLPVHSQPIEKDIPFLEWVKFEIKRLNLGGEWYQKNFKKVVFAPRKLSGVIIFDGYSGKIIESRLNYYADLNYKISHREMADVEDIFKTRPGYLSGK